MAEVQMFLKMLHEVYSIFGLDYSMALSTRPEGYLGELELWNKVCGDQQHLPGATAAPAALSPGWLAELCSGLDQQLLHSTTAAAPLASHVGREPCLYIICYCCTAC
jgi:hypothetical protein